MLVIESGLIHYYITNDDVKLVNRSSTPQPEEYIDDYTPPKRISETTKRRRYKNKMINEHNRNSGLMFQQKNV